MLKNKALLCAARPVLFLPLKTKFSSEVCVA